MKREIKFRAWDGKTMDSFSLNNDFDCHAGWLKNSILMQYTGLKDKNGKEIYEGDIVRNVWRDIYKNNNINELVRWNNGYHFQHSGAHTQDQTLEIIGNIYEHPAL